RERAGADADAVRIVAAVADAVPAHVAARGLDAHVRVPGRRLELAWHLAEHRTFRNAREALAQDSTRLLHLTDPHHVAVEAGAERGARAGPDRHVELELGIDRVRQVLPHVEPYAGAAEI